MDKTMLAYDWHTAVDKAFGLTWAALAWLASSHGDTSLDPRWPTDQQRLWLPQFLSARIRPVELPANSMTPAANTAALQLTQDDIDLFDVNLSGVHHAGACGIRVLELSISARKRAFPRRGARQTRSEWPRDLVNPTLKIDKRKDRPPVGLRPNFKLVRHVWKRQAGGKASD